MCIERVGKVESHSNSCMALVHKLRLKRVVLVLPHASVTLAQISYRNKVLTMRGSLGRNSEILVTTINLLNVRSFICLWYMTQIVKDLFGKQKDGHL